MANLAPLQVYWHAPAPLFAAQVNMASVTYPVQDITYDGVTTGTYTDLGADMFFTLGSAAGLDDYGRGRLRAAPTSTVLKVGRASQGYEDGELSVVNDAYITVYDDFRVHAKIPAIVNYVEYKDADLAVGDLTQDPPPVATMGPDRARRIDASTSLARFYFDGSNSYAVADGATIASYAWVIGDGSFELGTTSTDAAIYADFAAGVRYVSLTVTDSLGSTHTTRRLVLADDPADSLCVSGMQVTNITRSIDGTVARLRVLQDLPRADYPDGAHVLIWEDRDPAIFGTPDPTDWTDVRFSGWHQVDQASSSAQETHLRRETELTCVDVAGRLDSLPGFNQRVEKPDDDGIWTWGEMSAPNMDKFLHYLIHWHSTALTVADFYPSLTWTAYPFVLFDAVGDTLFNQLSRQANRLVPDHQFTCDRYGVLRVVVDPMLQDAGDRTATVHNNVTEDVWQSIEFGYQRPPRVHTLRGSAVLTGTDYELDGEGNPIIGTAFCIAPGTAPSQGGRESTIGERLAQSQEDLNAVIGHHYARLNARYGPITATLNSNSDPWLFDPAAMTWVQLHTTDATAPQRGLDFTTIRTLCREVSIDYAYGEEGMTQRARVVLEAETVGLPALTEEQEEALPVGEQPVVIPPPDFGLVDGQDVVAMVNLDGYLYRTADFQTPSGSGGPTWDRVDTGISETIYSWVVDPFSPGYINQDGTGAINGWIATETDIYRVTDIFGVTPGVTSVHTFAQSATAAAHHWRSIQASFGRYFDEGNNPWLLCVSYYGDTEGHAGTWATYSTDGGGTWSSEVEISSYATSVPVTRFNPIGVYASPRTPGLAYTAAYGASDDPLAPVFALWPTGDSLTITGAGASTSGSSTAEEASALPGTVETEVFLVIAPPPDAVRINATVNWSGSRQSVGLSSSNNYAVSLHRNVSQTTATGTPGVVIPDDGSASGTFTAQWDLVAGTDWPVNNVTITSAPPSLLTDIGARIRMYTAANAVGGSGYALATLTLQVIITEIELDDTTTYTPQDAAVGMVSTDWGASWTLTSNITPGQAQAGSIHVPWEDNVTEALAYFGAYEDTGSARQFRLKQGVSGTISDISPSDGSRSYGVNRYGFAIRAYDSDRQHLLLCGIGNDTSGDPADDYHGVWVSSDAGANWTNIVTPVVDDAGFALRPAYEAAFAGDSSAVIFVWGPPATIAYSADSGSTLDDRSGNLSSFSPEASVGIAGGPTGGA